jgi:hypothetical protein
VDGFGDANNLRTNGMAVYNSRLYVGTENNTTGAEVWEHDGVAWAQVNVDGFGDANNLRTNGMAVYNSRLYVGTRNDTTGTEVWEMKFISTHTIPTFTQWGMIILSSLMAGSAILIIRRRKLVA